MATFNSSDCTAVPAKAHHVGVNYRRATFLLNETASGSTNINMIALPPGARVFDVNLMISNNALGIVAAPGDIRVQDSQGNVYITSSSANKTIHTFLPSYGSAGNRLTSSANLMVVCYPVATGTGSTTFIVTCAYTKEDDGD